VPPLYSRFKGIIHRQVPSKGRGKTQRRSFIPQKNEMLDYASVKTSKPAMIRVAVSFFYLTTFYQVYVGHIIECRKRQVTKLSSDEDAEEEVVRYNKQDDSKLYILN
jgi:hypothetical protein